MTTRDDRQQEQPGNDQRCTDTKGAAEMLGLSPITLHQWRVRGQGPAFHRFGRQIRYRLADVRAYMDACRVGGRQ